MKIAKACPDLVVVGPGHDGLWDAPGFSKLTTPLFTYISDQEIIVINHMPWFYAMSGDKRDKLHVSISANNLESATKHLAHLGALLRSTMSFNHSHRLRTRTGCGLEVRINFREWGFRKRDTGGQRK